MTRGKQKPLSTDKPNLIFSEVYTGALSKNWEGKSKYSIAEKGKSSYTLFSNKSLEEMQEKHRGSIVKLLK